MNRKLYACSKLLHNVNSISLTRSNVLCITLLNNSCEHLLYLFCSSLSLILVWLDESSNLFQLLLSRKTDNVVKLAGYFYPPKIFHVKKQGPGKGTLLEKNFFADHRTGWSPNSIKDTYYVGIKNIVYNEEFVYKSIDMLYINLYIEVVYVVHILYTLYTCCIRCT